MNNKLNWKFLTKKLTNNIIVYQQNKLNSSKWIMFQIQILNICGTHTDYYWIYTKSCNDTFDCQTLQLVRKNMNHIILLAQKSDKDTWEGKLLAQRNYFVISSCVRLSTKVRNINNYFNRNCFLPVGFNVLEFNFLVTYVYDRAYTWAYPTVQSLVSMKEKVSSTGQLLLL